jgi:hypothetical protein
MNLAEASWGDNGENIQNHQKLAVGSVERTLFSGWLRRQTKRKRTSMDQQEKEKHRTR